MREPYCEGGYEFEDYGYAYYRIEYLPKSTSSYNLGRYRDSFEIEFPFEQCSEIPCSLRYYPTAGGDPIDYSPPEFESDGFSLSYIGNGVDVGIPANFTSETFELICEGNDVGPYF